MLENNKKRVKFIVNPFAGIGKKQNFQEALDKHLDKNIFAYQLEYTTAPGHAIQISAQAVKDDFDIIIAVGGDGSVNEVASQLVGTNKILGIIPAGSGNGLSTHLGYSRNITRAIKSLNTARPIKIDTCILNDKQFFNVAGVGFDAWIAHKTKHNKIRGFIGYLITSIREAFAYKLKTYSIKLDGKTIERQCLTVEVANATMFGYSMKIAPLAKLDDGLFDVVIINKAHKLRYFLSMIRFPFGNIHKSRLVEYYNAKEVEIFCEEEFAVHFDGEGFLSNHNLKFSINQLSLTVLSPK
ncbi:MAG: diacylglycerol kinase (ATP) [Saprospiraceae bacterium]|jgi:diacylglycerol kinase (ATP)